MSDLTPTERQVLLLIMDELDTSQIAEHLSIERSTVKTHRRNLYRKTGTHNAVALVNWGRRRFQAEQLDLERALNGQRGGVGIHPDRRA